MSGNMRGKSRKTVRAPEPPRAQIGRYRGRHLVLAQRQIATEFGRSNVTVDESESPLAAAAIGGDRACPVRGGARHQIGAGEIGAQPLAGLQLMRLDQGTA